MTTRARIRVNAPRVSGGGGGTTTPTVSVGPEFGLGTPAEVQAELHAVAWATPAMGVTLEDLEAEMVTLGNTVLEVDTPGNRLKLLDWTGDI